MVARRRGFGARAGLGRLGCLVQIILVGGLIYFGMLAGRDLLDFYRYRDAMKQVARFATVRSDQQIKDHLRAYADSIGLPVAAKDVNVVREGDRIRIWAEYDEELKLPFEYRRSIHLRPSIEKTL
ncbi:MAG TPA: hypothetical protein VM939_01265 [Gemmatimonadaceae bacterium]|nr:hypothetical protein [Gemmatimonadaceae bacterium]